MHINFFSTYYQFYKKLFMKKLLLMTLGFAAALTTNAFTEPI